MTPFIIITLLCIAIIILSISYNDVKLKNRQQAQIITEQAQKINELREAVIFEREIRKSLKLDPKQA